MNKIKGMLVIDLGHASVKMAYGKSSSRGVLSIFAYGIKEIPPSGDQASRIIEFINNFLRNNNIEDKEASLTVSDLDTVSIKHLVLPAVPKQEILQAIKWQLKTEVSFDIDRAMLAWQIVKEYIDEEGAKKNDIVCIYAQPGSMDKYISILSSCGLEPVRISNASFNFGGVLRVLSKAPGVEAVLDMGYIEATLSIYKDGRLCFVRSLPFSSDKLTRSLTAALATDHGPIELSYAEAEELKRSFGIPLDENAVLQDNITGFHVISLMRPFLEGLTRELTRSFEYFATHLKEESPAVLYITGGGAELKNLDSYLKKELGIRVELLSLSASIDSSRMSGVFATFLTGEHGIDLLPREIKARKLEFVEKVSLRIFAVALAAIFLFSFFVVKFQSHDYNKRLQTSRLHLNSIAEIKALKQKIDLREALISKIEKNRVSVESLLKVLSNIVPREIFLEELSLDQAAHAIVLKGVVSGGGVSPESVLTPFIGQIEASPFFTEATLISSKEKDGTLEFEIRCDLAH
jgi:type IV pilus assembly protein PilM